MTSRPLRGRAAPLRGRRREASVLAGLVAAVRAGQSRVLVVHGAPGVGKTALLDQLAGRAAGCRVVRVAGVQSEMEFAYAGLHQLLAPMLDRLDRLPAPQQEALRTVFAISAGPPPDRFLVALAVLSLLAEVAREQPLVCVVDDQHWLDQASAQALGFVARRLAADPVALVFAARVPGDELAGLPELMVERLAEGDARALLDSALTGPLDSRVRDQIVAEAEGNPLALLELPRGLTPAELAGGFGLPGAQSAAASLRGRIEDSFQRRLHALPDRTRQLLLLAAADPSGDPALVWRAAGRLGLGFAEAEPAAEAGLAEFGTRVRFRHPLVRSVAYQSAPLRERQRVHAALAGVTDLAADPDRRAWHLAQATDGPDEDVAAELEQSADRAQARGGLAAAAAFLERAARLTADPARRSGRTVAAAQASLQAGAVDKALGLLVMAEAGPLDERQQAQVNLLRARIAHARRDSSAPWLLLRSAEQLETLDLRMARDTYLDAHWAAHITGRLTPGVVRKTAEAALRAPRPVSAPTVSDLLLDGLATGVVDGYPAGVPMLKQVIAQFREQKVPKAEELRWLWAASVVTRFVWDDESQDMLSARHVELGRETGVLAGLPVALGARIVVHTLAGELAAAEQVIDELRALSDAMRIPMQLNGRLIVAAWRGRAAEAPALIDAAVRELTARGEGGALAVADYARAVLMNGLGRYPEALSAAAAADAFGMDGFTVYAQGLSELIEAAARSGAADRAADALRRLSAMTHASGTDWGAGLRARCQALLTTDDAAEALYLEAVGRLGRTRLRPELARAHLLYGEWLRRQGRRRDAREQLRTAYQMLDEIGMEGFAERARRELQATGETARKRTTPATAAASQQLTAQETQVALLARDGLSNPEIGARLFISSHTVQYHLGKVFAKLGISSRGQLHRALPGAPGTPDS